MAENMSREEKETLSQYLRKKGYITLPKLWIHPSDMPLIHAITGKYRSVVAQARTTLRDRGEITEGDDVFPYPDADPRTDKEAAWAAAERDR